MVNVRRSSNALDGRRIFSVCPADTAELGVGVIFTMVFENPLRVFTLYARFFGNEPNSMISFYNIVKIKK
jgi:hypothetical protein